MGVTHNIPQALSELQQAAKRYDKEVVRALKAAGERAVETARQTKTYEDKTGDLTASIGYGVIHNGLLEYVGGFDDSRNGGSIGRQVLQQVAEESRGVPYAVILVAGMEYATYVNRKGFAVLDGAQIRIDSITQELLSSIRI